MTVRKFRPPNRLAAMIKDRGGILAKDAVAAAEANVETLRDSSLAALDEALEAIEARFGPTAAGRAGEDFETLYTLTLKIIDVAGFAADAGVDEAAVSLCALVDNCAEAGAWRWDAVDVHLSALRLLRNVGASLPAEHRRGMLDGLHKVAQR
ncbi:chemotaxis protein CheE [Caulobacter sp. D4A]|uniref:chemotaxis protein CheE n=1 Tax=unclassified Caulobacter TaxID=2648921 RepID=UPI000D73C9F7|nr:MULTISPECIES: chemotaxis protein CheE [unclassified Caulobacter]PXA91291.1 chemotaxis protein CheE [Caulobacter sp. D4A]PXA93286.1 chemotaxis protein CheE [Caulobacter sp. D5]